MFAVSHRPACKQHCTVPTPSSSSHSKVEASASARTHASLTAAKSLHQPTGTTVIALIPGPIKGVETGILAMHAFANEAADAAAETMKDHRVNGAHPNEIDLQRAEEEHRIAVTVREATREPALTLLNAGIAAAIAKAEQARASRNAADQ